MQSNYYHRVQYGPDKRALWENHIRYISPDVLSSSEKLVLFIFMASRPMGDIFLSNETVCFQSSLSLPTVKKILKSLKDKKFIERVPHKKSRSSKTIINELLILEKIFEGSPAIFKTLYNFVSFEALISDYNKRNFKRKKQDDEIEDDLGPF
jgi:DNA-binding MarR family transcriptional regulator